MFCHFYGSFVLPIPVEPMIEMSVFCIVQIYSKKIVPRKSRNDLKTQNEIILFTLLFLHQ